MGEKTSKGMGRPEIYAKFRDPRVGMDRALDTREKTPYFLTLQQLAILCWANREKLLSDEYPEKHKLQKEIAAGALHFLETQEALETTSGEAEIVAEHLADKATERSYRSEGNLTGEKEQLRDQSLYGMTTRLNTLNSLGRNDVVGVCRQAEIVLSKMISQLPSLSTSSPETEI
jgi:hypothetical protein